MTESPVHGHQSREPSLDQQVALRAAAARLAQEFDGVADDAAIEGLLHAAYDHVADHANLDHFLPLLAERYTREWLRAAAEEQKRPG
ncbi:three-helix bundle dimerization domain-containing protein [Nocardia sp. NPDC050710]|uniref:three-helix bundle dimerization domain-containing protein n=1 Tax=Nocardia sp. NPDC050710 TaxID=3157220 RepID=UPI0033E3194C